MTEQEIIEPGYCKGEKCNRNGCAGIIMERDIDGCCSCHINPPCSYCTTAKEYCPICEWDAYEENAIAELAAYTAYKGSEQEKNHNEFMECIKEQEEIFNKKKRGELPIDKIEWRSSSHTHFSMIKEGLFPPGTTREELLKKINGTFGGRFEYFNEEKGTFKFIAYTD